MITAIIIYLLTIVKTVLVLFHMLSYIVFTWLDTVPQIFTGLVEPHNQLYK